MSEFWTCLRGSEEKYFVLFHQDISSSDWAHWDVGVNINNKVVGADTIEIYFEASPDTANFNLDNIVLDLYPSDDSWKDGANARIDEIRKSDVQFNFVDVDATELSLEVVQVSHSFPFGQAVASKTIAACHEAGEDDNYCTFIRQNYNWLVSSFRMKWKHLEPHQGDFEVEIPDKMIAWAAKQEMRVRGERTARTVRAASHSLPLRSLSALGQSGEQSSLDVAALSGGLHSRCLQTPGRDSRPFRCPRSEGLGRY